MTFSRATFQIPAVAELTEEEAVAWIGHQMTVHQHGHELASGTVVDVRRASARAMMVTVESGGRACAGCRTIHPEDGTDLVALKHVRETHPGALPDLPVWAPVCVDQAACEERRCR